MNITTRVLNFIDYLHSSDGVAHYGCNLLVTKESTWTPFYAIFIVMPEYAHHTYIQKKLYEQLKARFTDCEVRFNANLNEIEIEHPKSSGFFEKHRDILEEIGMKYEGWTAFLTDK